MQAGFDQSSLMTDPKLKQQETMNQGNMVSAPYFEANKIITNYLNTYNFSASKFIISSFRWDELKKIRSFNKDIPIAILVDSLYKIDDAIKLAKQINAVALNPNKEFITKDIVNKIQSKNIKVYPYTINTPRNIRKMRSMGVDAIITDYPERIKR